MAQTKAIVDKLLSNVSSGYQATGLIADQIFPEVKSVQKTGKLGKHGTAHLRIERSVTGGRGEYRRVETTARTTDTYSVESHGLEGLVTEDDYDNVEQPFEAEQDETLGLTSVITIEKEKIFADSLFSTSIITQNVTLAGTEKYTNKLDSDPINDFQTARATIYDGCGLPPNHAIMPWKVWNILRFHPAMLDVLGFKDNRPGGLNESELASALGVEKLLISSGMYESAKEGQASALAPIWSSDILFYVRPSGPAKMQVSLGYQVKLTSRPGKRVLKYSVNNPPNSTGIIVDDSYDLFLSNVKSAYLIKGAI